MAADRSRPGNAKLYDQSTVGPPRNRSHPVEAGPTPWNHGLRRRSQQQGRRSKGGLDVANTPIANHAVAPLMQPRGHEEDVPALQAQVSNTGRVPVFGERSHPEGPLCATPELHRRRGYVAAKGAQPTLRQGTLRCDVGRRGNRQRSTGVATRSAKRRYRRGLCDVRRHRLRSFACVPAAPPPNLSRPATTSPRTRPRPAHLRR